MKIYLVDDNGGIIFEFDSDGAGGMTVKSSTEDRVRVTSLLKSAYNAMRARRAKGDPNAN